MSIEALKSELRALPAEARRKLMAFMVALQNQEREVMPQNWLTKSTTLPPSVG
jgi:hypothetical protein